MGYCDCWTFIDVGCLVYCSNRLDLEGSYSSALMSECGARSKSEGK